MEPAPIRVLHTVASLQASSGGPSRSVPALCEGLGRLGLQVTLLSQAAKWPAVAEVVPDASLVKVELIPALNLPRFRMSYAPGFARRANLLCGQADLLHDHGLWLPANRSAAAAARRCGRPLVISPRGMLDAWSMLYRSWKKKLAWRAYQHRALLSARAFCATSPQEAEGLRSLGLGQPIAVIPNGVELPRLERRPRADPLTRTALFLSRLHPKKGLLDLVRAWSVVGPAGWRLVIAGPDEGGHRNVVEAAVREAGLGDAVRFAGAVEGEAKTRLMMDADLFVLPSLSENFGIVVAEALACAVPVLTTRGTPWKDLAASEAGWWVDTGASSIEAALREAIALPDAERAAMGMRGRALVEDRYAWTAMAAGTRDFYAWLLGRGDRPACVVV